MTEKIKQVDQAVDTAAARKLVEEDKNNRAKQCPARLEAMLKELRCRMDIRLLVTSEGNQFIVNFIALD